MELRVTLKIPETVKNIEDSFSKELIELWEDRKMSGKVFFYEEKKRPLSYILVQENGYTNTIRGLYVIPEKRGKGLGTEMVDLVYSYYESLGATTMFVNITEGAEKLYSNLGFTILGRRRDFTDQFVAFKGTLSGDDERSLRKKVAK